MNKDKVFAIFFVVLTLVLCDTIWQIHLLKEQTKMAEIRQNDLSFAVSSCARIESFLSEEEMNIVDAWKKANPKKDTGLIIRGNYVVSFNPEIKGAEELSKLISAARTDAAKKINPR